MIKHVCIYSSLLFLGNGIYALTQNKYDFVIMNTIMFIISILNYIYDTNNDFIYYLDIICANIVFIFYVYKSFNIFSGFEIFLMINSIILSFMLSCLYHLEHKDEKNWQFFHMYFHFVSNICIFMIINKSK
jgi:hypothetical protein